jgi:hypothetical protein
VQPECRVDERFVPARMAAVQREVCLQELEVGRRAPACFDPLEQALCGTRLAYASEQCGAKWQRIIGVEQVERGPIVDSR